MFFFLYLPPAHRRFYGGAPASSFAENVDRESDDGI
jgi:hypothetical protein